MLLPQLRTHTEVQPQPYSRRSASLLYLRGLDSKALTSWQFKMNWFYRQVCGSETENRAHPVLQESVFLSLSLPQQPLHLLDLGHVGGAGAAQNTKQNTCISSCKRFL